MLVFLEEIYDDQWVYLFGAQIELAPGAKVRAGYAWNDNPMNDARAVQIGGVTLPDGVPALRYIQAQFAVIGQHLRVTAIACLGLATVAALACASPERSVQASDGGGTFFRLAEPFGPRSSEFSRQIDRKTAHWRLAASDTRHLFRAQEPELPDEEIEDEDEIETDRDSFTPATTTAGDGRWIVEVAYSFVDNRRVLETHSLPEFVARWGVADRLELRFGWNYEVGGAGSEVSGSDAADEEFAPDGAIERESELSWGFKYRVSHQEDWFPASSLIAQGTTPTSGIETATEFVGTYVFGWRLPNDWLLDGAIRFGTATEERDQYGIWAPSVVLKAPVGARANVHVEYFGLASDGRESEFSRHYVSPGVHYLITPDLEFGVRVGWGLNAQTARFFSNVGLGWRF